MPLEPDSPKPFFEDGSPKAPETTILPSSQLSPNSEKAPTPDDDTTQLEALVLSARKTGWAECLNEVTKLMVIVARLDDPRSMMKVLVHGLDDISKQGASLHA